MAEMNDMIRDQAIAWALRVRGADFDDWDAFSGWLESDALHNIAYEEVLLAEDQFMELMEEVDNFENQSGDQDNVSIFRQPANDGYDAPVAAVTRRHVMSGVIAASLIAAVSAGIWTQMPQPYDVMTGPGQRETVMLPDGSQIRLNGNTKIELDHRKPRYARLDRGEALFKVIHDNSDPFIVDADNVRLVDAGTEFNVVTSAELLDVSVSEGLVIYNPERENVRLPAGKRLYRDRTKNRATLSDIGIEQVGAWRTGQLGFTGEPLSQVSEVLTRNLGVTITASEAVAARTFSGVIQLEGRQLKSPRLKDGDPENIEPIAALLGVRVRKHAGGWMLIGDDEVPH